MINHCLVALVANRGSYCRGCCELFSSSPMSTYPAGGCNILLDVDCRKVPQPNDRDG